MVAESYFTNAFAADGITPAEYGHRTVLEYRSQMYAIPQYRPEQPAITNNEMDVITANDVPSGTGNGSQDNQLMGFLGLPDPVEAEHILRFLGKLVDVPGMSVLDPRYFHALRVIPPMYFRNSSRAILLSDKPEEKSPRLLELRDTVLSYLYGKRQKRNIRLSLLSWHWTENLLAIATGPHLDRLCAYNFMSSVWETSGERIPALMGIKCISFRPFSGRTLAVGCNVGVALLRGQRLDFLREQGHTNIVSLDWSPDGSQLATASATDGTVRLWDIGTHKSIYIGKGSIVRFSPNEDRPFLFLSDSTMSNFRLYCCQTWSFERWGSLSGPVAAITWSKDGSTILFSTEGESAIHAINVGNGSDDETRVVHTEVTGKPQKGPGGTPILMDIDGSGERLAVAYDPDEVSNQGLDKKEDLSKDENRRCAIALYATQLKPNFRMNPIGYISGPAASGPPVALKFKPTAAGIGAILACMWKSGYVSFTQLNFKASS